MAKGDLKLTISAIDKATAPLRAINKRMQEMTKPIRAMNNSFRAMATEAGLPRIAKAAQGVGSALGKVGSQTWALGQKLALMGTAAAYGMYRIVRSAIDAGDELATLAQRVGLGVDAYAQLRFAAAQSDVEQAEFNTAMDQFTKRLGEAKAGTGSLLMFLEKVSPALAAQVKGAKNSEDAFALMADAFEKVKDPARRAALANSAFGRSGIQMGQWLGKGSAELTKQRARYLELAGSQEKFAAGAGAVDEAMRETETAFMGLRNAAAAELFPALTELAKALSGLLAGKRGEIATWAKNAGDALLGWVNGGGLDRVIAGTKELFRLIGNVVDRIGGFQNALLAMGAIMAGPAIFSIFGLVSALGKLEMAMLASPFGPFIAMAQAVALVAFEIRKNWEPIKELFTDMFGRGGIFATAFEMMKNPLALFDPRTLIKDLASAATPSFGAGVAAPVVPPPGAKGGESHVTVDFNNVPKGVRVSADPKGTAPLDLSVGMSMQEAT